jgi:T5SS/PEP-CTERM-associated repeat protein
LTVSAGGEVVQAGSGVFVHNSLIRVQDAGSSLVAPFMWLGNGGSAGSLEVLGGATVRCSVGLGPYDVNLNAMSVRVAGPGSRLTGLYETNQGSTLVEQGGAVSSLHPVNATPEDVYVGQSISGSGLITVRDAGSVFDGIATLTLGGVYHSDTDGRGELRVLGGASVQAGRVQIAQRTPPGMPASVLLATGAGSSVVVANDLVVGLDGRGLVRIESGANVSSLRGQVGYNPASHGSAVVTGGASWSVGEWIGVGEFSRGDLAVDGGTVSAANLVAVGGGAGGLGSATVSNGGTLSAGNTIAVGSGAGSSGTVEVIGAGSVATAGAVISIGEDGATGSVTVDQGGLLRATTNALNVGLSSDGDMTVSDGGIVECVFARVGRLAGSTGSVLVTGANSRWTASSTLFLGGHTATGPGGDAALTVSSGAFVNAGASIGMWRDATLDVTGGGRVLAGAATPAGVPAGSIAVGGGGLLFGGGFILGNVHMLGGTLAPAFAEGSITLRGGLTVGSDASVVATISGSGHFDTVTATGPIQLAGSLRVATLGGYLPGYGDGFDVLVGSTIIGAFDTTETPGYSVSYLPDRVRLTPICDPDYNQDGALNQDDVDAIINDIASGTPSFPPNSPDLNRDGNVDQDDVAWLVNVIAGGNCS